MKNCRTNGCIASACLCIVLFSVIISTETWAADKVYRAALPHVPGVMYRDDDGMPGGFAAELLRHIAEDEQISLQWVDGNWTTLYEKTKRSEIDVLINTQVTKGRQRFLDFLEAPLYIMWSELYVNIDTEFTSINQLENRRIAVARGDNNARGFARYIERFGLNWEEVEFNSHEAAIEALRAKEVFAMAGPTPAYLGDAFTGVKRSGLVFNPSQLSISFPKGKNPELKRAIDNRLAIYRKDPNSILFKLMRRHNVGNFVEERDYIPKWVGALLLGLLALSLISTLFVVLLRAQVRRRTRELAQSNKKLWQAANIAKLGYWDYVHETDKVQFSIPLAQLLEMPDDHNRQFSMAHLRTFIHPEDLDAANEMFEKSIRNKERYSFPHRIVTVNGKTKWVQAAGYHEFDGDTPITTFGIILDITERIIAQQKLESSAARLNHSERMESIGQLAGGIAHDFNNMLAGIIGYAELLAEDPDVARIRSHSNNIINAAEKAAGLTSRLLAFARKEKLTMKAVSLHDATIAAIKLLKRTIDKKIVINTDFSAPIDIVSGDSASLTNAILNLSINSRDAMPEGGTLSIVTGVSQITPTNIAADALQLTPGKYIRLQLSDTGNGISKDNLRRIFEPFFTTKPVGQGTGLGLAAVYGTIKSHKGDILIESEENKGTCVTIYLPLQESGVIEAPGEAGTRPNHSLRLLLVEDEPLVRNMSCQMLASAGHSVAVAADGQAGLEQFNELSDNLDGVILDLLMPKMSGHELLAHIRTRQPQLPVLVVSGYSNDHRESSVIKDATTAFLQKPFRKHQLLDALDDLMQQTEDAHPMGSSSITP